MLANMINHYPYCCYYQYYYLPCWWRKNTWQTGHVHACYVPLMNTPHILFNSMPLTALLSISPALPLTPLVQHSLGLTADSPLTHQWLGESSDQTPWPINHRILTDFLQRQHLEGHHLERSRQRGNFQKVCSFNRVYQEEVIKRVEELNRPFPCPTLPVSCELLQELFLSQSQCPHLSKVIIITHLLYQLHMVIVRVR